MKRSDEEDPVNRLADLRNLRLENLELQHDGWGDFAPVMPVVSADPGISRSAELEASPTGKPVVQAESGMDQAALSRAIRLSVEAKAVRDFLECTTSIAGDLIDDIINKGGICHLNHLKSLTEEDLTHPERSIIAPRVVPVVLARLLIQESIPRMLHHDVVSHDLMTEFFSAPILHVPVLTPAHTPEHVIPHGHILLGSSPASANISGTSPTLARGHLPAVPLVTSAPLRSECGNCHSPDNTVVIRRVGPDLHMMLCQLCFNMVEMGRQRNPPSNSSSGSSNDSGCSDGYTTRREGWLE